jgi:predicted RNase H-like nuclease
MPENDFLGLDGCKAGWVMVSWSGDSDTAPQASIITNIHTALDTDASCIGVDMPIGFPADTARSCEAQARQYIGPRRSSVFPVPCREAVMADDYRDACEINARVLGKKFSKQAFMLFPKMREIDAAITPQTQSRVFEVHPEVAFCALNNDRPLSHAKKTADGAELRRALLTAGGFPLARLQLPHWKKSQAANDDILDACACCWSARRIATGNHLAFPAIPEFDARDLRMQINA